MNQKGGEISRKAQKIVQKTYKIIQAGDYSPSTSKNRPT